MLKFTILIIGMSFVLVGIFYIQNKPEVGLDIVKNTAIPQNVSDSPQPEVFLPYRSHFEIYTNGTKRIFTDAKYHNLSKDVYIEYSNPAIIQVKKSGITWDTFFKTLPFKLDKNCLTTGTNQTFCTNEKQALKFILNGTDTPNVLDLVIKAEDKLVVKYE